MGIFGKAGSDIVAGFEFLEKWTQGGFDAPPKTAPPPELARRCECGGTGERVYGEGQSRTIGPCPVEGCPFVERG